MTKLKALWRFCTAPEFELWWSGFFLCQILHILQDYPKSNQTGWDMAYIAMTVVIFMYSTTRGVMNARKASQ